MQEQTKTNTSLNNKRIAKNTMMLYIRMIATTLVSLYTARLTLQLLGVEDYGIQNVVSGIIGFMSIITGTMQSATQRFLAYDLGTGNEIQYQKTFSMLINFFACFSICGICLMESIGPWFIDSHLNIPEARLNAAQWIFQFSVITFATNSMSIPLTSSIVAYERMGIYAYFTFIDVAFKLIVVYILYITPFDKLITIGALSLIMNFITKGIFLIYCNKNLFGCKYIYFWDSTMFKRIGSYASWNLLGSTTTVMNHQGQAIILNMFFGPVVNAAKAIADRINSIIYSFSSNFYLAVTPQIIKNYSSGNIDQMRLLVMNTSRYSFYLLWIISFPIIINMPSILNLWLGSEQVSHEMICFCQYILVFSLVNVLEQPMTQTVRATGNIKKYQIIIGSITLLFLPICYLLFLGGLPAYSSMILLSCIYAFAQLIRVYLASPIIQIEMKSYLREVLTPIFLVCVCSVISIKLINIIDINYIINIIFCLIMTISSVYFVGINEKERLFIKITLKNLGNKFKSNS